MLTFRSRLRWKKVVAPPVAAGLLVQTDLGRLECTPPSGMFKISSAGANNSVPTTGLPPCIIIVHVYDTIIILK